MLEAVCGRNNNQRGRRRCRHEEISQETFPSGWLAESARIYVPRTGRCHLGHCHILQRSSSSPRFFSSSVGFGRLTSIHRNRSIRLGALITYALGSSRTRFQASEMERCPEIHFRLIGARALSSNLSQSKQRTRIGKPLENPIGPINGTFPLRFDLFATEIRARIGSERHMSFRELRSLAPAAWDTRDDLDTEQHTAAQRRETGSALQ